MFFVLSPPHKKDWLLFFLINRRPGLSRTAVRHEMENDGRHHLVPQLQNCLAMIYLLIQTSLVYCDQELVVIYVASKKCGMRVENVSGFTEHKAWSRSYQYMALLTLNAIYAFMYKPHVGLYHNILWMDYFEQHQRCWKTTFLNKRN